MSDSPQDLSSILENIRLLAPRAVESERAGQVEQAAFLYRETARLLQLATILGGPKKQRVLNSGAKKNLG